MRIGILIPSSEFYPYLGADYIQGLNLGLNTELEIFEEEIGVGSPQEIQKAARKLITRNNVDLLTGWMGYKSITAIRPLIQQTQTPLIMCNAGEVPLLKADKSPFIVHCSLNLFNATYLAAKWAFQEFGEEYVNLVSFFDAGYPFSAAVNLASEKYNAQIKGIDVSHKDGDKDVDLKLKRLLEFNPKFLFASYSGWDAVDFLKTLNNGVNAEIPIVSSSMLVEQDVLKNISYDEIYSVNSWYKPDHQIYANYEKIFKEKTRRNISPFALIASCSGIIISHLIKSGWNYKSEIADLFFDKVFESPVGNLTFDKDLNSFESEYFLCKTLQKANISGGLNQPVKQIVPDAGDVELLHSFNKELGGWLNTYLCI